jgi:O-antigen/teichoic acid export membrane protein
MTKLKKFLEDWRQDKLLGSIIRNTGYMFSSNTLSMLLATIQGILAAIVLGPKEYGSLGLIVTLASNVNRFLSFRMGDLVVKFCGSYLAKDEKPQAAAVIKLAGLAEFITSLFAYGLLVLIAPIAAKFILKDETMAHWIIVYGVALLANFLTETSTALLQLANKFRLLALLNLLQNSLTAIWIVVLFFTNGNVYQVLMAYLAGKFVFGFGVFISGIVQLPNLIGNRWWHHPIRIIENKKELVRFAISTNLSGTVNLLIRDSEVLWVGFFWSSLEVGYYKFGLAVMNVLLMPITPLLVTTYPEINRLITLKLWNPLKNLLRKTTLISFTWTASCALGLVLFGKWLLSLIKNGNYLPSLPVVFILLFGYGMANVFFWNRNLLLSLNRPNRPLFIMGIVGLIKTILMIIFVPKMNFLFQAGLLSLYFVISVLMISLFGILEINRKEKLAEPVL